MRNILKYSFITTIVLTSFFGYKSVFADANQDCIDSLKIPGNVSYSKMTGYFLGNNTTLTINTEKCINIPLNIALYSIMNGSNSGMGSVDFFWSNDNAASGIPKIIPKQDKLTIKMTTYGDSCYGNSNNPDCQIYTEIKVGENCSDDNCTFSSRKSLFEIKKTFNYHTGDTMPNKAWESGVIFGQCEHGCGSAKWKAEITGGITEEEEEEDTSANGKCLKSLKTQGNVSFKKIDGFIKKKVTILTINTTQCHGIKLDVSLSARSDGVVVPDSFYPMNIYSLDKKKDLYSIEILPTNDDDTVSIVLRTSEMYCYGDSNNPDCQIYTKIKVGVDCNNDDCTFSSKPSLLNIVDKFDYNNGKPIPDEAWESGVIFGQCERSCSSSDKWYSMVRGGAKIDDETIKKCRNSLIKEEAVTVDPMTNITGRKTTVKIKTNDCKDIPLKFSFRAKKNGFVWADILLLAPGYNLYYATYRIYDAFNNEVTINDKINNKNGITEINFTPKDDTVTLTFLADDNGCYGSNNPDCIIMPRIMTSTNTETDVYVPNVKNLSTEVDNYEEADDTKKETIREKSAKNGVILSDCDSSDCSVINNRWELIGMTGAYDNGDTPQSVASTIEFDKNSPCYSETKGINPITGEEGEGYLPNCYEFLAPIQGIELDSERKPDNGTFEIKNDPNTGRTRIAIKDIRTYELGNYINKLFQIAIEILGVISVIMIIIAGVEYMTVESVYGKSDAKKRITGAVTGLLLALGIFTILHTINPKLLEVNFGKDIGHVSISEDSPSVDNNDGTYGHRYTYSGDWPPKDANFVSMRKGGNNSLETIIPGVYVNKKECTKISKKDGSGGDNCTSLYFEPNILGKLVTDLTKLKKDSNANKIIITGGSEYWWHKTHGPKDMQIDIRSSKNDENDSDNLNNFFYKTKTFPGKCKKRNDLNINYINFVLDESSVCNSPNHSHVSFK